MRVGVVPDLVPFGVYSFEQPGKCLGIHTDHEERGRHPVPFQDVEYPRRVAGIGAVIEGQRDKLRVVAAAASLDDVVRWISVVALREVAGLRSPDVPGTMSRAACDSQDLAFSVQPEGFVGIKLTKLACVEILRGPAITSQHAPHGGVFSAEPPEPDAARARLGDKLRLVEDRDRIQEPDLVLFARGLVAEDGIAGSLIP